MANTLYNNLMLSIDIRSNTGKRCLRDGFRAAVKRKHLVTKQDCYNGVHHEM